MYIKNDQSGSVLKKLIIAAVALTVAVIIAASLVSYFNNRKNGPAGRTNTFVKLMSANDTTDSYNMFTKRLKSKVTIQAWQQQLSEGIGKQHAQAKLLSTDTLQGSAEAYGKATELRRSFYSFAFDNGKTYKTYIIVLNEDGQWKVDELDSILQ